MKLSIVNVNHFNTSCNFCTKSPLRVRTPKVRGEEALDNKIAALLKITATVVLEPCGWINNFSNNLLIK